MSTPWRRIGLRREVLILLPVTLFILIVLSLFTLLSYRNALRLMIEERQEEAARWARLLAVRVATHEAPTAQALRRLSFRGFPVALVDGDGWPVAQTGSYAGSNLLAPLAGEEPTEAVGVGPGEEAGDAVVGFAPLGPAEERRYLRVDLPATLLANQQRNLSFLTLLVLSIDGGLALLLLLFVRHLLAPYESLLERAREMGQDDREADDEVAFLMETFDRALVALNKLDHPTPPEDEITALERALAPSLDSGLLLLDREGGVLALNPTGSSILGVPSPEQGKPFAGVLGGHQELVDILGDAVAHERTLQRRECALDRNGESLTLGLTVHPLRRNDGSVRGYLVLFADLTEVQRQAKEKNLAESLSRIGELAAGVAHELRNSVASLRGYLTLIERSPEEESIRDYLSEIRHEADHLQRVLEDFLSFARPGTVRMEEVDLEKVVQRAAVDPALAGTPVVIGKSPAATPLPLVRGDAQLLERALRNLLHNAVQAQRQTGAPDEVSVGFELDTDELRLAVEDRGPGIPPEMRDKLFLPFATGRPGGVGLGLSLAHRIVDLHGGRIRLEERGGGGTRAVIFFPAETFCYRT